MDLINELAAIHGYRSYLEICTYTTGRLYADLDRGRFTISHRLMYRCPESFDDGLPIDFRSASSEIATQLTALRASGVTYDLILVDPFHDYEQSRRHLRAARSLLTAKGTIVVHDCRPPDRELASPEFLAGAWCGVTYKAYLDFMLEAGDLQFCTVDVDHGCGIIRRRPPPPPVPAPRKSILDRLRGSSPAPPAAAALEPSSTGSSVMEAWKQVGDDYEAAFRLVEAYPKSLLNLQPLEDFLDRRAQRIDAPQVKRGAHGRAGALKPWFARIFWPSCDRMNRASR